MAQQQSGQERPVVKDYEKGVVYLVQFDRTSVIPTISPFCMKLETWLRIHGIAYKNVISNNSRSSEGTLPFVELDGVEYPDSELAIRDLIKIFGKEDDESRHLSRAEAAIGHAFELMVERSTLFDHVYFRRDKGIELFALFKPGSFDDVEKAGKYWMDLVAERLRVTGVSKHSPENVERLAEADLTALSDFLGDKPFFAGQKANKTDATIFSVLSLILYLPFDTPQQRFIEEKCPNLIEYCERMKTLYWPDWEEATKNYSSSSDWKKAVLK